ncbi:MAG: hypothetical protein ACNS60_12470 [Candidatus Cyclobacteriaceae bacterium M2_1C_046]
MRIFLFLILITISNAAIAQQALLKFKTGETVETYITSIDSVRLNTVDTSFFLSEINEVVFHEEKGKDIHLYYELEDAGVEVNFDEEISFTLDPVQLQQQRDPLSRLKSSLNEYRKAQQIGSGLQLAGVLLGATGVLFDSNAIAGVGLGVLVGGLVYEISASRHLSHLEY